MIPSVEYGGVGETVYFLHANGYPPDCYRPLLVKLAGRYRVRAMLQRPLWESSDPQDIEDWIPLSDDLLRFLDQDHAVPAAVIGHSLGGIVALRAALRQPRDFSALVAIEPVLLLPVGIRAWQAQRASGQASRHPLIVQARNRRQVFDDLERLFSAYRSRENFRFLSDEALQSYIDAITFPASDGTYRLRYSAAWEERIYYTGIWRDLDIWQGLPHLQVPTLIIRGAKTDTFLPEQAAGAARAQPALQIETVEEATHLVPMERPDRVAALIFDFLSLRGTHTWPNSVTPPQS